MPLTIIKSDPKSREKPCLRCGYSLRKIMDSTHCPECGLSVWLSLNQNDTLEMSNPHWLRRMAIGLWIMAAANLLSAVAYVGLAVPMFQMMAYHQRMEMALREWQQSPEEPAKLKAYYAVVRPLPNYTLLQSSILLGAAGFGAYCAGLFITTSNEGRYPDKLHGFRFGVRVVCGAAALSLLMIGLDLMVSMPLGLTAWLARLTAVFAGTFTFGYLRQLARRMPHKTLMRICAWMTAVPLVSLFYSFIRNSDWPPDVLPLIYLPASVGLFVWFAILFKRTAGMADSGWAAETALTR